MKIRKIIHLVLALALFLSPYSGESQAKITYYKPQASGTAVEQNDQALVDYSHSEDGYVMVKYLKSFSKTIKVQVFYEDTNLAYNYDIQPKKYEVIPLTEGSGSYKITVNIQNEGNSYLVVMSKTIEVSLTSEFAPYIRPNQYVNYNKKTKAVKKANRLTKGCKADLKKVKKIYKYVIKNFTYDKKLAKTVKSNYVPNLNKVFKKKKGICFDYASLMTAMMRSQGIPTKLVIGYTGNAYHAWVNVYSKKKGWITGAIYFNGKKWKLMDPTYASTSKSSKSIMKYIGNAKNYKAKFSY
ncbi:MAG: transglutaminase-like domain-containing protein [Eubacterium sp.]|nr:transglutaminase-like domain-containing protein [Eubacterium sp.]